MLLAQASDSVICLAEKGVLYSAKPLLGVALGSCTRLSGLAANHGFSGEIIQDQ